MALGAHHTLIDAPPMLSLRTLFDLGVGAAVLRLDFVVDGVGDQSQRVGRRRWLGRRERVARGGGESVPPALAFVVDAERVDHARVRQSYSVRFSQRHVHYVSLFDPQHTTFTN